jgi:mono/diheme cytochrome c family protein
LDSWYCGAGNIRLFGWRRTGSRFNVWASIAAGQKIYSKICAMCHGKTGDADGPAVIELNIHPAKLSDPKLATESDGSLFWKITTGKKPMPGFGKRFSETDRWNLVNYIRTLPKR